MSLLEFHAAWNDVPGWWYQYQYHCFLKISEFMKKRSGFVSISYDFPGDDARGKLLSAPILEDILDCRVDVLGGVFKEENLVEREDGGAKYFLVSPFQPPLLLRRSERLPFHPLSRPQSLPVCFSL